MDLETLKEEIRARADVVDVIGRVVRLQKAGGTYKGLCPFHTEKTPSFNVDPKKQSYHCFGCGAGGDVFTFVMEHEHVDFMGAMERLATQVGVPFEFDGARGAGGGPKKDRLFSLHERATAFFQERLHDPATPDALAYTRKRALSDATLADFRIGYAPNSFDTLLRSARDWGFTSEEIEASGLFGIRENSSGEKFYDRFRDRLMFPIADEQGRIIGFSGRILQSGDSKAKYVNSPETLLFKKSRVLYAIHRARQSIASTRKVVLCEGQLDVIRCHEAGVLQAVAAQGTAITEEHARILKRYADEVTLMLDADTAGVKAALRSAEVLLSAGLTLRVASLPPGEDPDSLVTRQGPAALQEVLADAESFVAFQVRTLVRMEGEITETTRLRVARSVMQTIAHATEAVHRDELIHQAAAALGMSEQALRSDMQTALPANLPFRPQPPGPAPAPRPTLASHDDLPIPERMVIEILLHHPRGLELCREFLRPSHFHNEETRAALEALYQTQTPTLDGVKDAIRGLPGAPRIYEILSRSTLRLSGEGGSPEEALRDLLLHIRRAEVIRRKQALEDQCRLLPPDRRMEQEPLIWQLTLHARRIEELRKSKDWQKASFLLRMLDSQENSPA